MRAARSASIFAELMINLRGFISGTSALSAGVVLGAWVPRDAFAQSDKMLEVMQWEGVALEAETAAWRESMGLTMRTTIMSNQDDVTAKLAGSSPVRLDVAVYSPGFEEIYNDLGILTKLDVAEIPNYNAADIFPPFFNSAMGHGNGQTWGIPWLWGLDTIVVRPDMAGEVTSYKDLLKPELTGKLAFMDNPLTTWPQVAKVTGYGDRFPNLTVEEMNDCFAKLVPYRNQTKLFATSHGDIISLFASGEIAACFCVWSAVPLETAKQGVKTVAISPKEGGAVWVDAFFIPKTAGNVEAAHGYINQALSPEIQASIVRVAVCNSVSRKAPPLMDEVSRSLFDYDNFDAAFSGVKIYGMPPRTSDQYATYDEWLQKWSDFRAGF
jgi:spermidine/putrescine-binding protein